MHTISLVRIEVQIVHKSCNQTSAAHTAEQNKQKMKTTHPLPAILVLVVVGVEVLGLDLSASPASLVLRLQYAQRGRLTQMMWGKLSMFTHNMLVMQTQQTLFQCAKVLFQTVVCAVPKTGKECHQPQCTASSMWLLRSAVSACDIYLDMSDAGLLFALSQLLPVRLLPAPW